MLFTPSRVKIRYLSSQEAFFCACRSQQRSRSLRVFRAEERGPEVVAIAGKMNIYARLEERGPEVVAITGKMNTYARLEERGPEVVAIAGKMNTYARLQILNLAMDHPCFSTGKTTSMHVVGKMLLVGRVRK